MGKIIVKDKITRNIPNFLTMLNMMLGLMSILLLMGPELLKKELIVAALICLGGIVDFFDGYIARKLKAVSNMGKQLDSFADLATFGIAPICLAYHAAPSEYSLFIAIPCGIYIVAGSYRLARYNLNDFSDHFMGLPITTAGILLSVYSAAQLQWADPQHSSLYAAITTMFILLLSIMMVSRVKIKRLHRHRSAP